MEYGEIIMLNYDIVIIDSGLDLKNTQNVSGICIRKVDNGFEFSNDLADEVGHGTIIYSIIRKQVPECKVFIIKLSECDNNFDASFLISALKYVRDNIACKIINISLGVNVSNNLSELYDLCVEISRKGAVIVSAFDNEGCHSYPAAFDCVIGVDNKNDFKHISEFDYVENSAINIFAKGGVQRLTIQGGKTLLIGGSSISCANITSILSDEISGGLNLEKALAYLKSKARYIYSLKKPEDNEEILFEIKNAVAFPFVKETHAFVRFADMLPFQMKAYYDIRNSGKVGRKLSSYYEGACSGETIKDIEKIDLAGIDTIILGHLDELNTISKRDYKAELINKAVAMGVNIYSFDSLEQYSYLLNDSDIKFFYPKTTHNNVPHNLFGKLYKISKPVVGIFGTSSQQGKFSLQLALKKELELQDYNVGAIGTEPHSLLFGFDVVFPMGYNSTVNLQNHEIVLYLNYVINNLCLKGKEIILAASQAQTIPYYCNNILEFPSKQYHFALGVNPDAIIMCINYHDEVEYIQNSVYALVGLTSATIIAFVMYPMTFSNEWSNSKRKITHEEFTQKANKLQKEFNIPVFRLGEQRHISDLCQMVIDFF